MSGVNCPGFAGIEKHWDDCCSIDFNFCSQTQIISIPDILSQLPKAAHALAMLFFTSTSAVAAAEKTHPQVREGLHEPKLIRAYHYVRIFMRLAGNRLMNNFSFFYC